jgi:hypothetical protein
VESLIAVTKKLKYLWWLGLIGFLRLIFDIPHLALFHFFFLFSLLGFIEAFRSSDARILFQSLRQLAGMVYVPLAHGFRLPAKDNYVCKGEYILPFTGKWVVVNGGVTKALSHSWEIPSQRYAYDFIILDEEGNFSSGDKTRLHSYYCYGKDVLAPAAGEVVDLRKHYKDSQVDGENAYCDVPDMRGNFITIRHGEREYSVIAHLLPDSITVNAGDIVKRGEVIAKCGNSGNTSQPHIHFQLQTGKSFFWSAGLPIAFHTIRAQQKTNYHLLDPRPCQGNLQVLGNNAYIARGLEVENGPERQGIVPSGEENAPFLSET